MNGKTILLIVLVGMLFLVNCVKKKGQVEYFEILKIPESEFDMRLAKFSEYPVETQIDIYIYADFEQEGGDLNFLRYISHNGEKRIGPITKRLNQSNSDFLKTGLMRVLSYIDDNCQCVAKDTEAIKILEKDKMLIDDYDLKKRYSEYFEKIKSRQNK